MLSKHIGQYMELELAGNIHEAGILIEESSDIIVLYTGKVYRYIPFRHIKNFSFPMIEEEFGSGGEPEIEETSFRKLLMNAKGRFVEILLTKKHSVHGYIVGIMNNYFVFYSPVFKTMFISMDHLKWLSVTNDEKGPYGLNKSEQLAQVSSLSWARTLEEQMKRLTNKLVVLDLGMHPKNIGKVSTVKDGIIEMVNAHGEAVIVNMRHVKSFHFPQ
ncbi:hypothetical protein OKW24_002214 [Peribacillus simplex]|uniref:DUF2642 domain-containing protein n=1 Tax=Peribacillus simplex TaxID=1478 RepID=UPI0024E1ED40|nr:DUF2642 domain-containing protein [Peribacillus simplex]MDF9760441.1 hypothetical protein [Peribacillus simplex]MDW7613432.1 DUF2642 domain-containing protein [Peribacillus simplex]